MEPRPLHLLLVGEDKELREALSRAFEDEQSFGSVRSAGHDRPFVFSIPEPDVVLVDAGPPPPNVMGASWHTERCTPLTLVLASDWSEETRELAKAVDAVAYVKKDPTVATIAPLVVALASLSAGAVPA